MEARPEMSIQVRPASVVRENDERVRPPPRGRRTQVDASTGAKLPTYHCADPVWVHVLPPSVVMRMSVGPE